MAGLFFCMLVLCILGMGDMAGGFILAWFGMLLILIYSILGEPQWVRYDREKVTIGYVLGREKQSALADIDCIEMLGDVKQSVCIWWVHKDHHPSDIVNFDADAERDLIECWNARRGIGM